MNFGDSSTVDALNPAPETASPGRAIPKSYPVVAKVYDPANAKQGESQANEGTSIFTALNEAEALRNMVQSVQVRYAEDCQTIDGQNGSERI